MSMLDLRYYQRNAVDATIQWVSAQAAAPVIVLPTGTGKSLTMGALVAEPLHAYPGFRGLILAHRAELIEQNAGATRRVWSSLTNRPEHAAPVGVWSASVGARQPDADLLVAGIQTAARDPWRLGARDLVAIDECHLVSGSEDTQYRKTINALLAMNPNMRLVGLSATPFRLGMGLIYGPDRLFGGVSYELGLRRAIEEGWLCPLTTKATDTRLDVRVEQVGVATRGGEYVAADLARAVDVDDLVQRAVDETLARAEGRKRILVFCAGVEHAHHVAEAFRARGVKAEAVDGGTAKDERKYMLDCFRRGTLRVLCNVDVLTTGLDVPSIDCVVLLRPTKSPGLLLQMVGRGFRLAPEEKSNCLVLDMAGNLFFHGPLDMIEPKEPKKRKGDAPVKVCPDCGSILYTAVRVCPDCLHEFPEPNKQKHGDQVDDLAPILSTEVKPPEPEWHDVEEVRYALHVKRDAPPGAPATLRVEYYGRGGFYRVASEWVCLDHAPGSFAHNKAMAWWRLRDPECESPDDVPSVEAAIYERLVDRLAVPIAIATLPDGRFTRIVDYRWEPEVPRTCQTCLMWGDDTTTCRRWDVDPPMPVQLGIERCSGWEQHPDAHNILAGQSAGDDPFEVEDDGLPF